MEWWQILVLLVGTGVIIWAGWHIVTAQRLATKQDAARRENHRKHLEERGELLPDGRLACLVCLKVAATEYYPRITRSKLDRDPWGHRKLHNQTPMYALRDDEESAAELCAPHKRMLVRKLEQKLSEVRARTASLNAQIEEELAAFETVELITWARMECERSMQAVQQAVAKAPDRLLPASSAVTVRLVPTEGEDAKD